MEFIRHLVVGAGVSGLAFVAFGHEQDYLILERDAEIGGYCKTIKRSGFVWDYSGHFFHFKNPQIELWLRARMPGQNVRTVSRASFIDYKGALIDFPFQKNIHQLSKEEFIDCMHDLYFARVQGAKPEERTNAESNFKEMLYARFGRSIAEKFLIPYNEKLYACDLSSLDKDAMGRFFPHADVADIVRNMKSPDNGTYNASFTYPEGGAIEYVNALASEVASEKIFVEEGLVHIDLRNRVATTTKRQIKFERLVSSIPFDKLVALTGISHDSSAFSWNKVLVFNLGFDRKGATGRHWVYFPTRDCCFYRIGYYDNIFETERLSLYVELGFPRDAEIDVEAMRARVLADLRAQKVIDDHELVAWHAVVMDPAYVHITQSSMSEVARLKRILNAHGVYSIGRYGAWTYCSIEDNIVEARDLAADFNTGD